MQISFSPINYQYNNKYRKFLPEEQRSYFSTETGNKSDVFINSGTLHFSALKKSVFKGIDFAIVEKFKAPIEKFKSIGEFQYWARKQAEAITAKDYGGRHEGTQVHRRALIKEWADYVLNGNAAYSGGISLLILSAVVKDLKADTDNMPPALNKGVLADCIDEINKSINQDPKYLFDFNKLYRTKLRARYLEDTRTGEKDSKWVVIPSKYKDPHNFSANVEKLKALSHKNWCTKSYNAEPYLMVGDFHIYLEKGMPKLGVRFLGNKIAEIQGELNNGKIPIDYLDIMEEHIKSNSLKLIDIVKEDIKIANNERAKRVKAKSDLKDAIENNDVQKIFEYFNIGVKKDKDGLYIISEYRLPSSSYTFADIGIDENKLFTKIKAIQNTADFRYSKVSNLGELRNICGSAYFTNSSVRNLGKLETIGGKAEFYCSQVTKLGRLKSIGGDALFYRSKVVDLGDLETIGGDATFELSNIQKLRKLKYIAGNANFTRSVVTDLGNLETIGGDADFKHSQMTNLNNLAAIGGTADFRLCEISSLGKLRSIGKNAGFGSTVECIGQLEKIGGDTVFSNSKITNLKNLEYIGGDANFEASQILNLGNLKIIGGDANFKNTKIAALENLEIIGGNADFSDSKITSLGNLKSIGRDGNFSYSLLQSLDKLEMIGGYANFGASQIIDLGSLKTIGSGANFRNSQMSTLRNLETINGNADFSNSLVNNLGSLTTIEGDAIFTGSLITNLGALQRIGGNAYMSSSRIVSLGNLRTIIEDAYISKSPLKSEDFKKVNIGGKLHSHETLSSRWRRFLGK